jgi:Avidin family
MNWKGRWRNQYGSILTITDDANQRISGTFRTALKDSGFYGQEIPVVGIHQGDCISFAGAGATAAGDAAVSYTGLLRDGKMETMWFVVADSAIKAPAEGAPGKREKLSWWRSISTSADTFERI